MVSSTPRLVLQLLSAAPGHTFPVKALLSAVGILGVAPNGLRVAVARLKRDGLLVSDTRGTYSLGPAALKVQMQVAGWRDLPRRSITWWGAWVAVHAALLDSADRSQARLRERALRFLGFRAWGSHFWVRPDNLRGGVADVRRRLAQLGLSPHARVFQLRDLEPTHQADAMQLWETGALENTYKKARQTLASSRTRVAQLSRDAAAKEMFFVGGEVIRALALDPILPAPMVDVEARDALVEQMKDYDKTGHTLWRAILTDSEKVERA